MPMGDEDNFDDVMIFPITDIEANDIEADDDDDSDDNVSGRYANADKFFKPAMSLRQRRRSKLGLEVRPGDLSRLNLNTSLAGNLNRARILEDGRGRLETSPMSPGKQKWLRALKKIKKLEDPWAKFHIDDHPIETCIRHRYNALKQKWVEDEVQVKMEKEPFNHGAMRSCYRLKKLSTFAHKRDWKRAHNYVAKLYMEDVERDVYFEDVRLQMDAKLWGEEYNRHRPPKKVDIFQMNIIEFKNRPDRPLYHLEHFIEGDYIKYNSNSGFVEEHLRLTPQAFSHFTFERSGHQLIVVDIQGVGDLWTDPQIHTADGDGYGDGNLGTRGMALFFHSHVCNSICDSLNLSRFDLSGSEVSTQTQFIMKATNAMTMVKGVEETVICASPHDKVDLTAFLARNRSRTISTASNLSMISDISEQSEEDYLSQSLPDDHGFLRQRSIMSISSADEPMSPGSPLERIAPTDLLMQRDRERRLRFMSESDDSSASTLTEEEERARFQQNAAQGHRPSCISHEINARNLGNIFKVGDSVLGQIHHDLAKYHEIGRFTNNENEIDWEAGLYHEHHAAELGVMEAMLTLAKLNLGMQPDVLVNCVVEQNEENQEEGLKYMENAAEVGDRFAMLYMAKAYETAVNLGQIRSKSYNLSLKWYQKAAEKMEEDDNGEFDATMDTPLYTIKAKMAELYLEGGFGLDKDPSYSGELYNDAAELAMAAMKGRMANKYYALSEEAYGQVEDPEE